MKCFNVIALSLLHGTHTKLILMPGSVHILCIIWFYIVSALCLLIHCSLFFDIKERPYRYCRYVVALISISISVSLYYLYRLYDIWVSVYTFLSFFVFHLLFDMIISLHIILSLYYFIITFLIFIQMSDMSVSLHGIRSITFSLCFMPTS